MSKPHRNWLGIIDDRGNMACGCGAVSCTALWWAGATEHQRTDLKMKAHGCRTCKMNTTIEDQVENLHKKGFI